MHSQLQCQGVGLICQTTSWDTLTRFLRAYYAGV